MHIATLHQTDAAVSPQTAHSAGRAASTTPPAVTALLPLPDADTPAASTWAVALTPALSGCNRKADASHQLQLNTNLPLLRRRFLRVDAIRDSAAIADASAKL